MLGIADMERVTGRSHAPGVVDVGQGERSVGVARWSDSIPYTTAASGLPVGEPSTST